jgi:hypothetical protein
MAMSNEETLGKPVQTGNGGLGASGNKEAKPVKTTSSTGSSLETLAHGNFKREAVRQAEMSNEAQVTLKKWQKSNGDMNKSKPEEGARGSN